MKKERRIKNLEYYLGVIMYCEDFVVLVGKGVGGGVGVFLDC